MNDDENELIISMPINTLPLFKNHYTIIEELGEGFNGIVYSAKDFNGKLYAVKFNRNDTVALIGEAILMSKISSVPNKSPFLTMYGMYNHFSRPAIVMEYFDGFPLENIDMPLNISRVIYIAKQIYSALNYLNERKMTHGDLDNCNILINKKDTIKLIDLYDTSFSSQTLLEKISHDMFNVAMLLRELLGYYKPKKYDFINNPTL